MRAWSQCARGGDVSWSTGRAPSTLEEEAPGRWAPSERPPEFLGVAEDPHGGLLFITTAGLDSRSAESLGWAVNAVRVDGRRSGDPRRPGSGVGVSGGH